ncbi:mucin-like protein 1, variant 3 [Coprinopsis cinerea AmutBmut pab1-1]|nr:mucin-like protein 1, variant 3 [Coprinopsis cinerea AmutBmut pab1-1]
MHEPAGISMQDDNMLEGTLAYVKGLLESITTGMRQDILENAITILREAIREADGDNDTKAKAEVALIKALITRFACHGWVDDLDEATRLLKGNEAIKSSFIRELQMMGPQGDHCPEIIACSLNLLHEYRQSIDKSNLDTAIVVASDILASYHVVTNYRAQLALRAGNALVLRYLSCGDEDDLSSARALFQDAKEASGTGDPMLLIALADLRHVGFANFLESGMLQGMSGLQEMARYVEAARVEDQEGQEAYELGSQLMQGDKLAIDEAILQFRRSLSLRPPQHPRRHNTLAHYALALGNRFACTGQIKDLEQSISLHKEALSLCPRGHPERTVSLNNLANALSTHFRNKGNFLDLDECIALHREALSLRPLGHPDHAGSLNNLANALSTRFQKKADFRDLDECIKFHREALSLRPLGHPDRGNSLNNLASALYTRFRNKGDFRDLDECIALHREALSLCPLGHPDRASSLNNLASALSTRFGNKGDFWDLDECIALHREALSLVPRGNPHRAGSLNNLANALSTRFDNKGDLRDLEQCISLHREALDLRPHGHPDRASSLNNLGSALSTRFGNKGDFRDLDECIALHREALSLRSLGHRDRGNSLNNLAGALFRCFQSAGNFEALTECIVHGREVLAMLSNSHTSPENQHDPSRNMWNHPDGLKAVNNLVQPLKAKHKICRDDDTLNEIFELLKSGVQWYGASPLVRLHHSKLWASTCREFHRPRTALDAYRHGISSLPVLASLDLTLEQRQNVLVYAKDLSKDAVQCAIEQNELDTALVFLSTARSVFWSQALQFRGSLDRLDALHPDLASDFRLVTRQLQIATEQQPQPESTLSGSTQPLRPYLLSQQREEIIAKTRAMEGFHDFLLPPSVDDLKTAARKGPIVFLNASNFGCHALILKEDGTLHRLALFVDMELLQRWVATIRRLAGGFGRSDSEDRFEEMDRAFKPVRAGKGRTIDDEFRDILKELWLKVGQPVISALGFEKTNDPRRMWWCPAGLFTFLPIHAAGNYPSPPSSESDCLSDYVVSSYCSAPQDLIAPPPELNPEFKMLVVIEPDGHVSGESSLPATRKELEKIESRIPDKGRLITRIGSKTNSEKPVVEDVNSASIVHFGCHGKQNLSNPLDSCLLLSEGRLTMSSLIRDCQASTAALAYLSACETAMGDEERPDESLTLAATMQFAGFRSVVATMWVIHDDDGPIVADAFYRHLFRHGTAAPPDVTDAAYGLHLAVKELREQGTSFHRWVPFVHHGI